MDDADLLVACPDTLRDRGERFTRIVGSEGQTRRLTFEVVGYREMLVRGKAPDGAAFYYFRKAEVVRCLGEEVAPVPPSETHPMPVPRRGVSRVEWTRAKVGDEVLSINMWVGVYDVDEIGAIRWWGSKQFQYMGDGTWMRIR